MSRILKIALIVLGAVVALIVAAAIALPLFFDPNDYKDELAAAVQEKTGRELSIPGDIELSVFPWLGAKLGQTSLANAEGFGDQPFAEIANAQVRVKLMPLFSRRIEIGTVTLDGMRLRLARNEQGRSNWDDLVEAFASDEPAETPAEETPDESTDQPLSMPELQIEAVNINDAAISWSDATTGESYDLSGFSLSTGRLAPGEPFRLNTAFDLSAPQQSLQAKTSFVSEIQADLEGQFYRMRDISLNVIAKGKDLPNGEQQLDMKGNAEVDMQSGRMKVTDMLLQLAGLSITGAVDGNGLNADPEFNGRLTVKQFNPRSVMQQLAIEPPVTQDKSALSSAGLDAQFDATTTSATLKQVLLTLDDTTLKGDASVRNFSKPNVSFKLDTDSINVDRYMPPENEAELASSKTDTQTADQAQSGEIELDPLRNLTLDGRVTVGKLLVSNLNITDAELAVTANDGVLRVEPLGANLYSGRLRMQGKVDGSGQRNGYSIQGNLTGLKFGPLLQDLIGNQRVDGLANLQVDMQTDGNTVEAIKRSLSGTLSFEFRDGLFNGFNLANLISTARARLLNEGAAESAGGETKFSRFAASFSAKNGVFAGKSFNLSAGGFSADGSGSYDLAANNLDYTIATRISEDIGNDKLQKLAGLTVPIKLSGDLFAPGYNVDIKSAMQGLAQQKLQAEKDKAKAALQQRVDEERQELQEKIGEKRGELNDKVQQKLQKGLSDLFGGSSKKEEAAEQPAPEEAQ